MVELVLSLAIIMVLAAVIIPTSLTTVSNIRLRGSASDFSGLVQVARIDAVQGKCLQNASRACTILFGGPGGHGAFVDLNGNGIYTTAEPTIQFGGNANNVAAPAGATGKPPNLDGATGPLGWTATSGNISFNSRGLPCISTATPCGANANYVFYFSDTRQVGSNGWAAVSISAAGRSKVWWWNGSTWGN